MSSGEENKENHSFNHTEGFKPRNLSFSENVEATTKKAEKRKLPPLNSDFEDEASECNEFLATEESYDLEGQSETESVTSGKRVHGKATQSSDGDDEVEVEERRTTRKKRERKRVRIDSSIDEDSEDFSPKQLKIRIPKLLTKTKMHDVSTEETVSTMEPQKHVAMYLDVTKSGEKRIRVNDYISKVLKPHQKEGLQFMWDKCFENIEMLEKGRQGSGCLLAHCMGLGKTLQAVALVHTLFSHQQQTKIHRVLILMPINVQLNWRGEFKKWTKNCSLQLKVYDLPSTGKDILTARISILETWTRKGGVFLMGYNMFSRLIQGVGISSNKLHARFVKAIVNADLVICDEGHLLKSDKTNISKSMSQMVTKRRIVLTGTPLQNNLKEYHCMISFVKPTLLGTKIQFKARFQEQIEAGQMKDSTDDDVKKMKRASHILHKLLECCVHRKDYQVIQSLLPTKLEYVLQIRLCEKQIELYSSYLGIEAGVRDLKTARGIGKLYKGQLFSNFQALGRIWTHPWVFKISQERLAAKAEQERLDSLFIDNGSSEATRNPKRKNEPESLLDETEEIDGSKAKCSRVDLPVMF